MKQLLIVGASLLQVPAIKKAKEMGLYVGVVDYNPQAVGVVLADKFFNVSTIDEEGVYQAAKTFCADGIITLATDMPMRSLAYACEKLFLPGISYDTAIKATDKGEMIKSFSNSKVEHPFFQIVHDSKNIKKELLKFPLITKPTDNSGSRGVMLVKNMSELSTALTYSSVNGRKGEVIIEEYMQGPEVSVEIMVKDSISHVLQITDKLTTGSPYFVEMGHSQPSRLSIETQEQINDLACRAVASVGINDGPAHVEIIVTNQGPKMVELGARMGGDCIASHLVPLSTGIDMVENTIRIALGETLDLRKRLNKGSAIRFLNTEKGVIKSISGIEKALALEGIREISIVKSVGDVVGAVGNSNDRIGYVIAQANTAEEAIIVCEKAIETISIVLE